MSNNKTIRVALYARVSTKALVAGTGSDRRQDVENQLAPLREEAARRGWVVVREYVDDGVSGVKGPDDRPQFGALARDAKTPRPPFDMVAAWAIDRLGRNLKHLVQFAEDLREHDIGLYTIKDNTDTTTAVGRMFFNVMATMAEFERERIKERIMAGLDKAKKTGTRSGKAVGRPKVPPITLRKIDADLAKPDRPSQAAIAKRHGVSQPLVSARFKLMK